MSRREFQFEEGSSRKFWAITVDGSSFTVNFGKIGTNGQTQVKSFASADEARQAADKLITEKTRKGYQEITPTAVSQPATPLPADPAPSKAKKEARESPLQPAPVPSPPPAPAPVALTRSIDLAPEDHRWVRWRKTPVAVTPRPAPAPFDFAACMKQVKAANSDPEGWWHWHPIKIPAVVSGEEARFWFYLFREVPEHQVDKNKRAKLLAKLKPEQFSQPMTVEEVNAGFERCMFKDGSLAMMQLQACWLPPDQLLDVIVAHPMVRGSSTGAVADWLETAILPHLSPADLKTFKTALSARLSSQNWPDVLVPAYLAVVADLQDDLLRLVEKWPDGFFSEGAQYNGQPHPIIFGLASATLVERHFRRLGLMLNSPGGARAWLALTEYAALDVLRDAVLSASNTSLALHLVTVLCLVKAPEAAPCLLDIKLKTKTAKVAAKANSWLEANPAHAIAGLLPLVTEKSKLGEAALQYLTDARNRGQDALIDAHLPSAPAAVQARLSEPIQAAPAATGPTLDPTKAPAWLREALTATNTDKVKLPAFVVPASLPPVLVADQRLDDETTQKLFLALAASTLQSPAPLVTAVRQHADRASLGALAWKLFEVWLDAGAPAKEKWAFLTLGHFGDDRAVLKLTPLVRAWPGESQHQRAVTGLDILRAIGTDTALIQLNGIAQKLKFKGLQDRAREMMEAIARDRSLTREQLEDRIVPDLDLDDTGSRIFDFGPRQFTFGFNADLEPMLRDGAGNVLKDLPKPGVKDDVTKAPEAVAEWKLLKKQAKEAVKVQTFRLEQAMIAGRRWTPGDFNTLLVRHPLLTHLVRRLLWAGYDAKGKLARLLRITEERTCADADGKPCTLEGLANVGLIHPLHLSAEQKQAWAKTFADYEILPPFPQLNREILTLTPAEASGTLFVRPPGRIPATKVRGTLEGAGWRRMLHDHGGIEGFYKTYPGSAVTAIIMIEPSILLSFPENEDQSVERVVFVPGANAFAAEMDNDKRYLPLAQVDPVAVSEVLLDITEMTATR